MKMFKLHQRVDEYQVCFIEAETKELVLTLPTLKSRCNHDQTPLSRFPVLHRLARLALGELAYQAELDAA